MATELDEEQDKALTEMARRTAQRLVENDRKIAEQQAHFEALWDRFWAHLQAKGSIG